MRQLSRERGIARLAGIGSSKQAADRSSIRHRVRRPARRLIAHVCALTMVVILPCTNAHAADETALRPPPASAAPSLPRFASLTFENDFFAGYDRHYTNGIQFAFLADMRDMPSVLRELPPLRWSVDPQAVVAIGQRIYTPANLHYSNPDPQDRPYAGWLYLMGDVHTRAAATIDHITVSVGVVGPASLASQGQNAVHRLLQMRQAQGWNHQIGDELTLMAGFERAWPGIVSNRFNDKQFDLALRTAATVGNVFTYASAGLVARFGRNLPDDLPVTNISLGPPRDGFRGTSAAFGWYVWLGIDSRAVARNIFIDGNTFHDSPHVSRVPYGTDVQLGIAAAWPTARIGFTMVQRSREFETQVAPDRFGQLTVSLAY